MFCIHRCKCTLLLLMLSNMLLLLVFLLLLLLLSALNFNTVCRYVCCFKESSLSVARCFMKALCPSRAVLARKNVRRLRCFFKFVVYAVSLQKVLFLFMMLLRKFLSRFALLLRKFCLVVCQVCDG
jgi:hypothetical protein